MAERTASSGASAVAWAMVPIWAALVAVAFGERPARREWAGLALGFVGVAALAAGSELRGDLRALALLAIGPAAWALGSVLARRSPSPPGLASAASPMLGGGLLTLAVGLATGERWPASLTPRAAFALAYLVIGGSVLGYAAYAYLLRRARPAVAMSYAYVNPAIAVVLGAAIGGEHLGPGVCLALALVAAGVVLMTTARRPAPEPRFSEATYAPPRPSSGAPSTPVTSSGKRFGARSFPTHASSVSPSARSSRSRHTRYWKRTEMRLCSAQLVSMVSTSSKRAGRL
jgi:drug/metabolite transporter (DMT)-like permease